MAADVSDGELCADQQSAAEADGTDDYVASEETSAPGGDQTPLVTFTVALQSLHSVQSYLEAAGCDDYNNLYNLTDQLYALNKQQQAVQKTMRDLTPVHAIGLQ